MRPKHKQRRSVSKLKRPSGKESRLKNRRVGSVKRPKLPRRPGSKLKHKQRESVWKLRRPNDCVRRPKRRLSG